MLDWVITGALAIALACAWWRRRDAVVIWLAGAFVLATVLGQTVQKSWVPGTIMLGDGIVALGMLIVVIRCLDGGKCDWCERSQRARVVALISTAKVFASLGYVGTFGPSLDWWWYAVGINAGFVLQVGVAGGWLNGLAVFLGRWRHRDGRLHLVAGAHRGAS